MSKQFLEYIQDLLSPFGEFKSRSMFGGYGIYKNGMIIAIIIDEELYFKADQEVKTYFESFGSEQFSYFSKNGKKVHMSYWKAVPDILEQQDLMERWIDFSYEVALRSKRGKR